VTFAGHSELNEVLASCRPRPLEQPNVLKTLLAIQQTFGYVPIIALPQVAHTLVVTEADVAGVLSYYPDLRTEQPGRHVIRVCMGESCFANHGRQVLRAIEEAVGRLNGKVTELPRFTVERVYCMGNCALSPTVAVDQDLHGRVSPDDIRSLLERYR